MTSAYDFTATDIDGNTGVDSSKVVLTRKTH